MNVADLIQELQKFPPHYTAMLVTIPGNCIISSDGPDGSVDPEAEWSFIGDVCIETNMGAVGPVVKIIAEDA